MRNTFVLGSMGQPAHSYGGSPARLSDNKNKRSIMWHPISI